MKAKLEGVLGPSPSQGDVQEVTCLNKIFRWVAGSNGAVPAIEIEPDPRHVDILIEQFGLSKDAKGLVTPGVKTALTGDWDTLLPPEETKAFRSACMRGSYLAEDRIDIRYAVKEVSRMMAKPDNAALAAMKHIARYLVGKPRLVQRFPRQRAPKEVVTSTDADFAGCLRTRQSTSCATLVHGQHLIKMIAATQKVQALATAESEFYALVRGAAAGIGLVSLAANYGRSLKLHLQDDATGAIGIARRRGAGKVRHIETGTLWLQRHITNKTISLSKIHGLSNWADLGTKHLPWADVLKCVQGLGFEFRTGRAVSAKDAAVKMKA